MVLIGGVEASAPESGEFDFGGLLAADIERIEVLRGPQSAIYGSNAIGGVISIASKQAAAQGMSYAAEAEVGTDGTVGDLLAARALTERANIRLSVAARDVGGYDIFDSGDDKDGDKNVTVNTRGTYQASDTLSFGGTLRYVDRTSEYDDFFFGAPTHDELVFDADLQHLRTEFLSSAFATLTAFGGPMSNDFLLTYSDMDDENPQGEVKNSDTTSGRTTARYLATVALDAATLDAADPAAQGLAARRADRALWRALVPAPHLPDAEGSPVILLDLDALSVELDGRPVVREASFRVEPGELVGLIGPNGAGKTSLMRAALGPIPSRGRSSLAALPPAERARAAAFMPQGREIAWPVSVETLVALGRVPWLPSGARLGPGDAAAVARALERLDLGDHAGRIVSHLSGGEQACAPLARTLAQETPFLIADESIAGFDPAHQIATLRLFREIAAEGRGVLLSIHDLGFAARYCTRLVLLHAGRIEADGPPGEVLTDARLAEVFRVGCFRAETAAGPILAPVELP